MKILFVIIPPPRDLVSYSRDHCIDPIIQKSTFLPFYLLPPVSKFRGVFGGRKLFLPGHFGLIFDGRVETCFYCEVSYGPLVGCVIGGVTQGHRRSVAITTGADRRGFVTNRGRDWSVATQIFGKR